MPACGCMAADIVVEWPPECSPAVAELTSPSFPPLPPLFPPSPRLHFAPFSPRSSALMLRLSPRCSLSELRRSSSAIVSVRLLRSRTEPPTVARPRRTPLHRCWPCNRRHRWYVLPLSLTWAFFHLTESDAPASPGQHCHLHTIHDSATEHVVPAFEPVHPEPSLLPAVLSDRVHSIPRLVWVVVVDVFRRDRPRTGVRL